MRLRGRTAPPGGPGRGFSGVAWAGPAVALYHLARGLLGLGQSSRAGLGLLGLTMALAALLITAGLQVWRGAPAAYERLHALTQAPHAWFLLPDHPAGDAAAAAIGADPAVDRETWRLRTEVLPLVAGGATGRRVDVRVYALEGAADPAGPPGPGGSAAPAGSAMPAGSVAPAGFALTAGRWPAAGRAEAVVDRGLMEALGLSVGDAVQLAGHDGPVDVRIAGVATAAMHCPYPECVLPPVLVPAELLTRVARRANMLLGVRLRVPDDAAAFAFAARRRAAGLGVQVETGNWLDVLARHRLSHSLTAGFFLLAGALSLAAGAAVTAHVVAAAALAAHRLMGLARAVGYTPRQVVAAFALGCAAVALAAAAAGAPAGAVLARRWVAGDLIVSAASVGRATATGLAVADAGGWALAAVAVAAAAATAGLGAWAARGAAWSGTAAAVGASGGGLPLRLRVGLPLLSQLRLAILPARPALPAAAVAIGVAVATGALTLANTMAAFSQDPARVGVYTSWSSSAGACRRRTWTPCCGRNQP